MSDKFEICARQDIGRAAWNAFVEKESGAWMWHLYEMQEALGVWRNAEDASFALREAASGEIVAVVPLQKTHGRALRIWPIHYLNSLGGPVLADFLTRRQRSDARQLLRAHLDAMADDHHCMDLTMTLPAMAPAFRGEHCPRINPLLEWGYENALTQTWVVRLKDKETLWRGMEGRARTAVRKAESVGVTARPAEAADLDAYYRLHCETYVRTGVPPHPRAYFEHIWRNFLAEGRCRIWIAEQEGEAVAAVNVGTYKNAAIYWTGASSARGLDASANPLLQWTAIQWLAEAGYAWYEAGEAFPGQESGKARGLSEYKKSFGGELYPYFKCRRLSAGFSQRLSQFKHCFRT